MDKKAADEDWANQRNWICDDQFCPNPYTHARGDPCKLTMEDLFPSRPEPPTSEDTRQPEDDREGPTKAKDGREDGGKQRLGQKLEKRKLAAACCRGKRSHPSRIRAIAWKRREK